MPMRQSKLFTKTRREAPRDEVSKNAQLLVRAGFVNKEIAGVYSLLPLGLRVMNNISNIVRDEMNKVGGQEIYMTVLQDSDIWEKTGRWQDDVVTDWFKTTLKGGKELGLGFTHEEPLTQLLKNHINSYKDLPIFPYQIQTKFRNELRVKSGMMRGREFLMKDMYSFTTSQEETDAFHEKIKPAYMKIFDRLGIGHKTHMTISSGGSFSKYSHEFQTLSDAGEDVILISEDKKIAINKDDYSKTLLKDFDLEGVAFDEEKSIEVGDIYKLGTKFSEALGLTYKDKEGKERPVNMGSYGIGMGRVMGTIVEVLSDSHGIVWPESIAPFRIHLIEIGGDNDDVRKVCKNTYKTLRDMDIEVLYDDRDISAGQKLSDADLIGIPNRVVVSPNTVAEGMVEFKKRTNPNAKMITEAELLKKFI